MSSQSKNEGRPVRKFPGFLFPFINVERSLIPENLADSYTFFLHAELQGHLLFFCDDIAELQGHENFSRSCDMAPNLLASSIKRL